MMGLITAWFDRAIRGRAAGFVVIGSGFAIIISGKLIPFVNGHDRPGRVEDELDDPRGSSRVDRRARFSHSEEQTGRKGAGAAWERGEALFLP